MCSFGVPHTCALQQSWRSAENSFDLVYILLFQYVLLARMFFILAEFEIMSNLYNLPQFDCGQDKQQQRQTRGYIRSVVVKGLK